MGVRPQSLRKLLVLLFAVSFIRTVLAVTPCRDRFQLVLEGGKCVCEHREDYGVEREEPNRACVITISYGECMATCPTGWMNEYRRRRSQIPQIMFNQDGSISKCPKGQESCPIINTLGSHHECVNTKSDVDNCGGCAATGEGVICGKDRSVRSASCEGGICYIHSCRKGYRLDKHKQRCVLKD